MRDRGLAQQLFVMIMLVNVAFWAQRRYFSELSEVRSQIGVAG
jgi:hypothetical protein